MQVDGHPQISQVGVVGCGTMGSGICEIAARASYRVTFVEVDQGAVEAGVNHIVHSLSRSEARGKMSTEEKKTALSLISGTTSLEELGPCELVIEAVPEDLDRKRRLFSTLDSIASPTAILATNTSSLPVIELAVATGRPERVVGLHFFNPPPVMELVELVSTVTSDPDVVDAAGRFAESVGKTVLRCRDRAGFIANLLLFPYLNEAVKLLEAGAASREDIDAAMRLGAGHPMGPLQLLDLVGLDSCAEILESLYRQFAEHRYTPAPAFRHLAVAGYLGRKTGKGFYTYDTPDSAATRADERSGDRIALPQPSRKISRFGIVGTGLMGAGLVEVAAKAGFETVAWGRSEESCEKARVRVAKSIGKAVERGKISPEERDAVVERVRWSTDIEALADCDLVLESVAEDLELKRSIFSELDRVAKPDAILGSGTSSLPVIEMAAATSRPEQVLGIHFFNPVPVMRLVELVRTVASSPQALADTKSAVEAMGKHAVVCEDRAGFIVNRLLFPFLNDAVRMLEEGYASAEEIDTAMSLGCHHPVGPLALLDLVGLDVSRQILRSLHEEFRESAYAPAPLLEHMVKAGYLGRKTGRGFLTYAPPPQTPSRKTAAVTSS